MRKKLILFILLIIIFISTGLMAQDSNAQGDDIEKTSFQSSLLNVSIFGSYTGLSGDIFDAENKGTAFSASYSDGSTKTGKPDHYGYSYGFFLEGNIFSNSIFQAGIRGVYEHVVVEQEISVGGGDYEEKSWGAKLITGNAFLIGPVVYITPFENKNHGLYGTVQYGIINGDLKPLPIQQSEGLFPDTETSFSGTKLLIGIGYQYAWELFHIGFGFKYGMTSIEFDENPYNTSFVSDSTSYNEYGIELYLGVHFF